MVSLRPVKTLEDFESMRRIRNECRFYMTRNQSFISHQVQDDWRKNLGSDIQVYLLVSEGVPAGYGLIRSGDDGDWISGGLSLSHRGNGLGKKLFQELIKECSHPKLEVLKSNARALALYLSLGFREVTETERETGTVLTMCLSSHSSE